MTENANLHDIQLALEEEATGLGIDRYRKAMGRGESEMQPGLALIKRSMLALTKGIEEWTTAASAGNARRNAGVVKYLAQFDADVAAFVTARQAINAMTKRLPLQRVALSISNMLEDCLTHDKLREKEPRMYDQLMRKIGKSHNEGYRHVILRRQQKYAGVETIKWDISDRLKMGQVLLHLMQETTGMIEVVQVSGGKNDTPYLVLATPATQEWLDKAHSRCELLNPVYMPMVIQPRRWEGPFKGGYLSKALRYSLVKTANRNYLEEMKQWDMPKVYTAINALQDTPWKINGDILSVMRSIWDGGGRLGGLPPRDNLPMPAKSFDSEALSDDPAVKAWKKEAALIHEENIRLVSKRVAMSSKLWLAEKFQGFEEIFFPHAMDWRGRCYPLSSFVNPQSDDSGKALLTFANGCRLGDNGSYWLAVHGANCFGIDKVSFAERVQWVQDNQEAILDSGTNALDGSRMWADADSPYMFLAFCMEWAKLVAHVAAGGSQGEFISFIPVGLDGSCNGLQNFSAMLRDEVGGKATNLVPNDYPSDIYAEVARTSQALIDREAAIDEMAKKWSGNKVTRKLVKRNTMTVPYSVSQYGMREQLMEELRKMGAADPQAHYTFEDATFLASKNYEAIGAVVVAARQAMEWLQKVAKVVTKDGLPIRWTAPSGMLVSQDYRQSKGTRFDSRITGRRVVLTLSVDGSEIDKRRMAAGIAPNFVHACDAAHMVSTVVRCADAGVWHFAMIHDSFGTHAGNIDVLAEHLRGAFVEQYSVDVLGLLREELVRQLPEKLASELPPVPPFGTLDLEGVNHSEYFFA